MKTINRVLAGMVIAAAILVACNSRSSLPKLFVGIDASFSPFVTIGAGKNEFTGLDVELMKAIASKAGYRAVFGTESRNMLLPGMVMCRYDAAVSAFPINRPPEEQIQFSDPYLTEDLVLVVQKSNITINSPAGLAGATVGVENGSPAASEVAKIPGAQLVDFNSTDQAFRNLIFGNVEAVVTSRTLALEYANIPANHLKIVGDKLGSESYAIAVCQAKPELLAKINAGLAAMKNDGTLNKLIKKWIK